MHTNDWFLPSQISTLLPEERTWGNPGLVHRRRACERIGDDSGVFDVRYRDGLNSQVIPNCPEYRIEFRTKLAGCLASGEGDMLTVIVVASANRRSVCIESVSTLEAQALIDHKACVELREEIERRLVDARIWPEAA